MARIAGVNIPDHKHIVIALTSIFGIGKTTSIHLCKTVGIEPSTKVSQLSEEKLEALRTEIAKISVLKRMHALEKVDVKAAVTNLYVGKEDGNNKGKATKNKEKSKTCCL